MAFHSASFATCLELVTTKPSGVPPDAGEVRVYYNASFEYYTVYQAIGTVWLPIFGTAQIHPDAPSSTPDYIGQMAIATGIAAVYFAYGTSNSSNWVELGTATGGGSS